MRKRRINHLSDFDKVTEGNTVASQFTYRYLPSYYVGTYTYM